MFKKIIIFIVMVLHVWPSWGLSCPSKMTVEMIAKMVIQRELMGIRSEDLEKSPCLNQSQFPYLKINPDYGDDAPTTPQVLLPKSTKIKNIQVKLLDKDMALYQVNYTLQGNKVIKDRIKFFLYKDLVNQKEFGCAGVIEAPKIRAVYKYCLKKCSK